MSRKVSACLILVIYFRWYNHLDPRINKNPWTVQEDDIVMLAHHHFGSKWAELAKILPGRYYSFYSKS